MGPRDIQILIEIVLAIIVGMVALPLLWLCIAGPAMWIVNNTLWDGNAKRSPFTLFIIFILVMAVLAIGLGAIGLFRT